MSKKIRNQNIKDVDGKGEKSKEMTKKSKIIAAVCIGVIALIVVLIATIGPIIKINKTYDNIFEKSYETETPIIVITNMKGGGEFSDNNGEGIIKETAKAKEFLSKFMEIYKDFKFNKRDGENFGAWDIRVRISDKNITETIYLSEDSMYYINGDVKYIFVPKNDVVAKKYEIVYNEAVHMTK